MALVLDILTIALLAGGAFFSLTGAVGMLRMPDFYSRIHPAGKNDTLGVILLFSALAIESIRHGYGWLPLGKLGLIVGFLMISAPAATHAITQAAFLEGLPSWKSEPSEPDGRS